MSVLSKENVKRLTTLFAPQRPDKYIWYRPFDARAGEFIQITTDGGVFYNGEMLTEDGANRILNEYLNQQERSGSVAEPTEPGWYRSINSTNWMVYGLDEEGKWHAFILNGDTTECPFSYIDQAGPIEMIARYR